MKNMLVAILSLYALFCNAQEFTSADDALVFLDENFTLTTQEKKGSMWLDPVMLQFEYEDAIYIHTYTGKISEKDYLGNNVKAIAKLEVKDNNVVSIAWDAIESINLVQSKGEGWITINGAITNMESVTQGGSQTFYVANAAQAEKIKAALEYLKAHPGE